MNAILVDQTRLNIQIPRLFLQVPQLWAEVFLYAVSKLNLYLCLQEYPDQALLLLVTGALGLRILESPLRPGLPVLSTFQVIPCSFSVSHILAKYTIDISLIKWIFWILSSNISALKGNLWALEWLWGDLPFGAEHLGSFVHNVRQEIRATKGLWASSLHCTFSLTSLVRIIHIIQVQAP